MATITARQAATPFHIKIQWAIAGEKNFEKLNLHLDFLLENIYKLAPIPTASRKAMIKEDVGDLLINIDELRTMIEVCEIHARNGPNDFRI